jgi:hypothetical protein
MRPSSNLSTKKKKKKSEREKVSVSEPGSDDIVKEVESQRMATLT